MEVIQKQRIEDLAKPESNQKLWIWFGYAAALVGGLLGIIIGHLLWKGKKTLPDKTQVYTYSESDRKHGKIIFYIGILMLTLIILFRILAQK